MTDAQRMIIAIGLVVMHMALLAAYTLPSVFIPERVAIIATAYVRPFFHQQWRLFAPDPPLCSSVIEVSYDGDLWQELFATPDHYLEKRIVRNIAHHVRAGVSVGTIHPSLRELLLNACISRSSDGTPMFRLREACVTDAHLSMERITEYTPIPIR